MITAMLLPGHMQTITRAEILGVLLALHMWWRLCIHIDNKHVHETLQLILAGDINNEELQMMPNNDLWMLVAACVESRPQGLIRSIKEKAHRTLGPEA